MERKQLVDDDDEERTKYRDRKKTEKNKEGKFRVLFLEGIMKSNGGIYRDSYIYVTSFI